VSVSTGEDKAVSNRTISLDGTAVFLSTLCVVHCLLLPVLAAVLPVLGLWAEAEWVHRAFVMAAVPISAMVFLRGRSDTAGRNWLRLIVSLGLASLVLGAFVEALHDYETILTVLGACLVATAHLLNHRRHTPI
jgi:hypothetical protein